MADVSTSSGYAMVLITVVITVMKRRHTVLFVVSVLDSFVSLTQIFSLSNYNSINHATKNKASLGTVLGRVLYVTKQDQFL